MRTYVIQAQIARNNCTWPWDALMELLLCEIGSGNAIKDV